MQAALYLHFPYCKSRCTYCDFNAYAGEAEDTYLRALIEDIRRQERFRIRTVFMGGGTPSLYRADQIGQVLEACRSAFDFWPSEITLEANPGTVTLESLRGYRQAGVDRLSFGVQTFDAALLTALNRIHSVEEVLNGYHWAREAGFSNVNLDLIYGLPGQTLTSWRDTVERALSLEPDHLSVYQLTLEHGTRLEAQVRLGEVRLPPDSRTEKMDFWMRKRLAAAGFRRYEVSNWARPGRESRHNLAYWNDRPYLGLGCGATGFVRGWRIRRILHPSMYARAVLEGRSPVFTAERMGEEAAVKDCLMMGLRIRRGVPWGRLERRFPSCVGGLREFFGSLPSEWIKNGPRRVRLTSRGADFCTTIQHRLMDVLLSDPGR